jgi:hypothetical protein
VYAAPPGEVPGGGSSGSCDRTVHRSTLHCLSLAGAVTLRNDTRDLSLEFIESAIPVRQCLGLSVSSEKYGWTEHPWRYPRVDFRRVQQQPFLARPTWLVVSSWDLQPVADALASSRMTPELTWETGPEGQWYLSSPPSPRLFALYEELLNLRASGYVLANTIEPDVRAAVEFPPPEIRIYWRPRSSKPTVNLVIPEGTLAGAAFNPQANGQSAIAIQGSGFECGDAVYWNREQLETTYGGPELLTAIVPTKWIVRAGRSEVSVGTTEEQSNVKTFWVR